MLVPKQGLPSLRFLVVIIVLVQAHASFLFDPPEISNGKILDYIIDTKILRSEDFSGFDFPPLTIEDEPFDKRNNVNRFKSRFACICFSISRKSFNVRSAIIVTFYKLRYKKLVRVLVTIEMLTC